MRGQNSACFYNAGIISFSEVVWVIVMSWWVYVLRCADDSLYTGITNDKARRLEQHNSGKASKYTRVRTPVDMVYSETAKDRSEATKREIAIKKLSRAQKLKLIEPIR